MRTTSWLPNYKLCAADRQPDGPAPSGYFEPIGQFSKEEEIKKYQEYLRDQPNTTNEQELACAAEDDSGWQFAAAIAAVSEDVSVLCPAMPVKPHKNNKHRTLIPEHAYPFSALVARPVGKTEILKHPDAQKALDKEWNKLVAKKTWDESQFYEWRDVAKDAQRRNVKAHVGRVFEICVEKGSELPVGDPNRLYKCRSVFQGNNVKDERYDAAVFQELGSSPATLSASKAADMYGLLPGNTVKQADAEAAYINAKLNSEAEAWVRLPSNRVPARWKHL